MKIIVEPGEVWDYFKDNEELLSMSTTRVAYNEDYGTEIYITALFDAPQIYVTADDIEVAREDILNEKDCFETARKFYNDYLTNDAILMLAEDDEMSRNQDLIENREDELDSAVSEFLSIVVDGYMELDGKSDAILVADFKEKALEYLAKEYNLSIYRPMILEDVDTGEEFFEEYPYECMVDEEPEKK